MNLSKVIKVKFDHRLRSIDQVERVRECLKDAIGEEYKFIICEDGMDLEPMELTYWGIWLSSEDWDYWLRDNDDSIYWFPCREVAEAQAECLSKEGYNVEAKPFNSMDEIDKEELKQKFKDQYA